MRNALNVESQLPHWNPGVLAAPQFEHATTAVSDSDLLSIMARQHEITAMLVHQHSLSLPFREI